VAELAGKDTRIELTGSSVSMSDELMSDTGNGTLWTIDDGSKNIFDPSVTFTVEVDSGGGFAAVNASDYTLRYLVGAVDFDSSQAGNSVRIQGSYLPQYTLGTAYTQDLDLSPNLLDVTAFQDDGTRRIQGTLDVSGSFAQYEVLAQELDAPSTTTEATLEEILLGEETKGGTASISTDVVYSYDPADDGTELYRAWIQFEADSMSASQGSAQEKEISFAATKQDAAMSSQTARAVDALST